MKQKQLTKMSLSANEVQKITNAFESIDGGSKTSGCESKAIKRASVEVCV